MSRTYPVHEVKAKLSEILRSVKAGRSVTISERGRPVARVVPVEFVAALAAHIDELEQAGAIVRGDPDAPLPGPVARQPGALRRFLGSRD